MPQVKKWGNSLALRIPVHLARQLSLQENTEVRLHRGRWGSYGQAGGGARSLYPEATPGSGDHE